VSDPRAPTTDVSLTIDGTALTVPKGTLIIRAAEALGILIPRFCDHPLLAPAAACRQCYVSVEGQRKLMTSCSTPVAEGMAVHTQNTDPEVRAAQEAVLEFLLINHPLDCPICDRGGECPLQDQTLAFGPAESRYEEAKRTYQKPLALSALVNLDRERCVLCQRCTRFCDEISGDRFIELFERGAAEQVAVARGEDFRSPFSGNTVQICPVGALTATTYRFVARPFDTNRQDSICTLCAAGCNILVQTRRGEVVRQVARDNLDVNEAWLCDKGRFAFAFHDAPERVATPLVRAHGLEPASFADAFAAVGSALSTGGGRAAFVVGGRLADEDAYVLSRFARTVTRTNDLDARPAGAVEAPIEVEAAAASVPHVTYADVEHAKAIVLIGLDAENELPILHLRLRKAARRGARIVVVHPRRTRLWDVADHVLVVPGTEADALGTLSGSQDGAASVLRDAGADGLILCGPRLAEIAGAVAAARGLAASVGARFEILTRRVGDRGGQRAGLHPSLLPGGRIVRSDADREAVESVWEAPVPADPGMDARSILTAAADHRLDLLFLVGVDVLSDAPDAALARRALENVAFKVVVDTTLHADVAPFADVVLPACASVERDGTYSDWEGRRQVFMPVRAPLGMSRPEWQIFQGLSEALGRDMGLRSIDDVRREMARLEGGTVAAGAGPGDADVSASVAASAPARAAEPADGLVLFSYPLLVDEGRQLGGAHQLKAALERRASVEVHPDDAVRLGLRDGGFAYLATRAGEATLPVVVTDAVVRGACFVPWNNPGLAANTLFSGTRVVPVAISPAEAPADGIGERVEASA
jgi:NADH-quinone oxidoreductase subunit G